jgi:hypothetical protein
MTHTCVQPSSRSTGVLRASCGGSSSWPRCATIYPSTRELGGKLVFLTCPPCIGGHHTGRAARQRLQDAHVG